MTTTNHTRISRPFSPASPLRQTALAVVIAAACGTALGNPQGAQIVNGQVTMVNAGNQLSITNTPGAIINWQNFSINSGEVTRFIQQGPQSSVLNRVIGQDPSQILGALQSNGKVFVINPNGILFGAGARVDVNGLVASSLKLSNEDFLAGKLNFNGSAASGGVQNLGAITTPSGGQVYLIAPNVTNNGLITSPQGDVMLAAGQSVKLADSSDPSMRVVVSAAPDQALNIGTVLAQGGKVGIYGALIRQRGVVSANSAVRGENGKVVFKASGDTVLEAGSVTSATGAGRGGEIQLQGVSVTLADNAVVDASGQTGGGTVLVGGDTHGANAGVQNATRTFIGKDAQVRADALDAGDGGKVIVWSDEATRAYGSISARAGQHGGSGGFVETSGHFLDVAGIRVDARAPSGKGGTWLLDPYDIEVRTTVNGGSTTLTNFDQFADLPATGISIVSADTISASGTTVVLQATHNLSFIDPVNITTSGVALSALAGNNLSVNGSIATNNGVITLSANDAGGPASGVGALNINNAISSNGGTINLSGMAVNFLGNSVAASGGNIQVTSGGPIALTGGSINAGAGSIVLNAGTAITQSAGLITGAGLNAMAANGIGTVAAPLLTSVGILAAINNGATSDIAVRNTGALHIQNLVQSGASTGSIRVDNNGPLTVDMGAVISNELGATTLTSLGALTVNGGILSSAGNITLEATPTGSSGDTVTVSGTGALTTGGAILLRAGATITLTGAVTGNTVTQQANLNTPPAPTPPTLSQCIADPTLSGCSTVLPTIAACTADPNTAGCSVVLPSLAVCTSAPTTPGCSVVLPSLAVCTSAPTTPGCSVVLPSLAVCSSAPTTPGCNVVLPTVAQCTSAPTTPGCSAVLPTLAACVSAPSTAGCAVVLPSLAACLSAPTTQGCAVVLPSLTACVSAPATPGCVVVLPSLTACVSVPATPGCAVVLPSLAACVSNPAQAGCGAVLPTLAQCTVTPTAAGCSAVLPTLTQCTASPVLPGCSVVLPPVNTQSPGNTPISQALNNTVNIINTVTTTTRVNPPPPSTPTGTGSNAGSTQAAGSGTPSDSKTADAKKEEKKDEKKDDKVAQKSEAKNEPPPPKTFCN